MRMCRLLLYVTAGLLVSLLPVSAQLMTSSWPAFRHDCSHSGRTTSAGPSSGILGWSRQIGAGYSSPAVGADAVYVLAGGNLIATDFTGAQLWSYYCGTGGKSSPAIAASGVIYVACGSSLYAVYPGGTLKWKKTLPGPIDASPTVGPDGTVYIGCSVGKLQAYTAEGALKWTYTVTRPICSSVALAADGTVYFGCDDGCLYALTSGGAYKWQFTTSPLGAVQSSPAVGSDGTVYFGSSAGYFYAVSPAGVRKWRYGSGVCTSSPAIGADGTIYFGSQDKSLYALTRVGGLKWRYTTGGIVNSSPAVDSSGVVYFASQDGSVYALNPDGTRLWQYSTGALVDSSPAIGADLSLYVLVSDGRLCRFCADATPPAAPAVIDDGAWSVSPGTLHAAWSSNDPETGIARYEYAVGNSPGAEDLVSYTDAGTATEVTRADLILVNGATYYFSVRAVNGAGLVSAVGVCDGISVDYTPPATPIVADDGLFSTSASAIHASWVTSDPQSGVVRSEYAVGASPGAQDIVPWTDVGSATEVTRGDLTLGNGVTYYISVRATNAAGLISSAGSSDGITTDTTPPSAGLDIISFSAANVRFRVTATDAESGAAQAQYAILGSSDPSSAAWADCALGEEDTAPGPFDPLQPHYVAARVRNGAGLWCEPIVRQMVLDTTPPTVPLVIDDGDYSTDPTTLHAVWSSTDAESGIASYSYCAGTAPGSNDVAPWTTTTNTGMTLAGLNIANGRRCYFSVKATNTVGLTSGGGSSNGITIDTTPPAVPTVIDDGDCTSIADSLHALLSASDAQSGVIEYIYCVGTSAGANDIVAWTSVGSTTSITIGGLSLSTGQAYYISGKARNGAGLWSDIGSSDGIQYCRQESVWPRFRCDTGNTGRSAVYACSSGHLSWRFQTQGYMESSAAFAGDGTAYVGSGDGSLYAINPGGSLRWSYQTGGAIDSSPAVDAAGRIYVGSNDGCLYCIKSDGTLQWKYTTRGMIWSSPLIGPDGAAYFGCMDGWFYALKADGSLKWRYYSGGAIWSSPALDPDGTAYFGSGDGKLYAISAIGTFKWSYQTGSAVDSSPAVGSNGAVYTGSGDGYFYAVNPNGTLKWRVFTGTLVDSSAAVAEDGTVYVGTGAVGTVGSLRAFSPAGVELWRFSTTGGVRSSPALDARGSIYFGTADGKVYALRSNGSVLWSGTAGRSVAASPAIGPDGRVIVGADDGGVYCFRDHSEDTTPPTTPAVTPLQSMVPIGSAVSCTWSASDPESGVQSYSYALGTSPGLADLINWTDAGVGTSMSRSDFALTVGQSCYVSVKATNHAGLTSAVGTSPAITIIANSPMCTIGEAKGQADGRLVYLPGVVVIAVFPDCVFLQQPDRSAGIRCLVTSSDLTVGAVVDAIGNMIVQNGEAVLANASVSRNAASPAAELRPFSMNCASACACTTAAGQGANTSGQLVRLCGRVTKTGTGYFVLSDGSGALSPWGVEGIEVRVGSGSAAPMGSCAAISGVITREVSNGSETAVLRAISNPQLLVYL